MSVTAFNFEFYSYNMPTHRDFCDESMDVDDIDISTPPPKPPRASAVHNVTANNSIVNTIPHHSSNWMCSTPNTILKENHITTAALPIAEVATSAVNYLAVPNETPKSIYSSGLMKAKTAAPAKSVEMQLRPKLHAPHKRWSCELREKAMKMSKRSSGSEEETTQSNPTYLPTDNETLQLKPQHHAERKSWSFEIKEKAFEMSKRKSALNEETAAVQQPTAIFQTPIKVNQRKSTIFQTPINKQQQKVDIFQTPINTKHSQEFVQQNPIMAKQQKPLVNLAAYEKITQNCQEALNQSYATFNDNNMLQKSPATLKFDDVFKFNTFGTSQNKQLPLTTLNATFDATNSDNNFSQINNTFDNSNNVSATCLASQNVALSDKHDPSQSVKDRIYFFNKLTTSGSNMFINLLKTTKANNVATLKQSTTAQNTPLTTPIKQKRWSTQLDMNLQHTNFTNTNFSQSHNNISSSATNPSTATLKIQTTAKATPLQSSSSSSSLSSTTSSSSGPNTQRKNSLRRKSSIEKSRRPILRQNSTVGSNGTKPQMHTVMEDLSLVMPVKLRVAEYERRIMMEC